MLFGEPTESSYGSAYQVVLEGSEACVEISQRHYTLRNMVQTDRGSEAVVSWYRRKQRSVALSSPEAEHMAASQAACEAIWMQKILVGLFGQMMDPTVIYCDNHSCIKLSENPVFHDRSKHIDIHYHHLRDCVVKRIMMLQYVSTEE